MDEPRDSHLETQQVVLVLFHEVRTALSRYLDGQVRDWRRKLDSTGDENDLAVVLRVVQRDTQHDRRIDRGFRDALRIMRDARNDWAHFSEGLTEALDDVFDAAERMIGTIGTVEEVERIRSLRELGRGGVALIGLTDLDQQERSAAEQRQELARANRQIEDLSAAATEAEEMRRAEHARLTAAESALAEAQRRADHIDRQLTAELEERKLDAERREADLSAVVASTLADIRESLARRDAMTAYHETKGREPIPVTSSFPPPPPPPPSPSAPETARGRRRLVYVAGFAALLALIAGAVATVDGLRSGTTETLSSDTSPTGTTPPIATTAPANAAAMTTSPMPSTSVSAATTSLVPSTTTTTLSSTTSTTSTTPTSTTTTTEPPATTTSTTAGLFGVPVVTAPPPPPIPLLTEYELEAILPTIEQVRQLDSATLGGDATREGPHSGGSDMTLCQVPRTWSWSPVDFAYWMPAPEAAATATYTRSALGGYPDIQFDSISFESPALAAEWLAGVAAIGESCSRWEGDYAVFDRISSSASADAVSVSWRAAKGAEYLLSAVQSGHYVALAYVSRGPSDTVALYGAPIASMLQDVIARTR